MRRQQSLAEGGTEFFDKVTYLITADLEEQLAMLKKQVEMMGGVSKGLAKVSDTTYKQAINQDTLKNKDQPLPTPDKRRIAMMPKDTLTDTQLAGFLKKIHAEVERLIPKQEKGTSVLRDLIPKGQPILVA